MSTVFLSNKYSPSVQAAKKSLQQIIATRPEEGLEIKKLIEEINKELEQEESDLIDEEQNQEISKFYSFM